MDERVWEKTAQFLKELRCEDTGRLSQLQLPEYQKAMKEKFSYQPIYEQTVCEMTDEQKCVIEKYVGLTEQCAEEENQQAYLQGMVDMLLLLSGSGILKVPSTCWKKSSNGNDQAGSCMCMDRFIILKLEKKLDKFGIKTESLCNINLRAFIPILKKGKDIF